jgi:hypothetical protein
MHPTTLQAYGYDSVGPGWRPLLEGLDTCIAPIVEEFCRIGYLVRGVLQVLRVKEKFGGLRIYLDYSRFPKLAQERIEGMVRLAEATSVLICEECGSPQKVSTRGPDVDGQGWLKTLCEDHHAKRSIQVQIQRQLAAREPAQTERRG